VDASAKRDRRKERRDRTRRRIVEAAVELHSTIGPARTSLSAVAQKAGVTRPTVYAYFPDRDSLFAACSGHVMALDPPPDPASWGNIVSPRDRLRVALLAQYAYYRRHASRIANIERDMEVLMQPGGPAALHDR
jgi:AcrR family transcriptional regulator